jgi:SAM-dependent methyltransferase
MQSQVSAQTDPSLTSSAVDVSELSPRTAASEQEHTPMETTPVQARFQDAYLTDSAPWVIDQPQPVMIALERAGWIRGRILDVGCGAGEHTVALTVLGYDVLGVDYAPAAVEQARANAEARSVPTARFEVADAMDLSALGGFDTIVDSAVFHIFDDADRARYVGSMAAACRPGGVLHLLALSDREPGFGPRISDTTIRDAFTAPEWELAELEPSRYRAMASDEDRERLGLAAEGPVDMLAWLARVHRL